MSKERLTWWVIFGIFSIILLMTLTGAYITLFAMSIPEGLAFVLGLIIFLLLGNRLLFGYAGLVVTLEDFLAEREIEREYVASKSKEPLEITKELSLISLLTLWLKDLDYYRYAYYGIFSLLLLTAVLTKLNLFGSLTIGNYIEGSFWGASVITFFVWALDLMSHYLMTEAMEKEVR
jgi:putative Ca2+/H+ antiporter (TMEM165/GDT1 family)